MEQRLFLVFAAISIQGILAAPNASSPLSDPSSVTQSKEAELSEEFQRLKNDAEQFRDQVLKFTMAVSSQLDPNSSLREIINKVADTATSQTMTYIKQVEDGAKAFMDRVGQVTSDAGNKALESTVTAAERAIEDLRSRSERMFNNGLAYLRSIQEKINKDQDLDSNLPFQTQSYLSFIQNDVERKLNANPQLPIAHSPPRGWIDTESQSNEDENQHLQRRDPTPQGSQSTNDNAGLTSAITQQYQGLRDSGVNVIKGVASLGTGSIIGILDGLSAILTTTTEVSQQAKKVLSDINRSGAHAVSSVIGTAGSLVSTTLDRTGSVVDSLRMAGGNADGKSTVEEVKDQAGKKN
ncbi:unnamed protein product [Bemisia tabaci]|uniref:Uncharacterized protein n=1 Tax=Bemisia tabaci TaxID=7038 RepID=A0A9P0AGA1_BEMTA|nr:unnamed protein product [Bemisia tabaci]